VIVKGEDRADSIERMTRALGACRIDGIKTNIPLHLELLADDEFLAGGVDTKYLDNYIRRHLDAA
jgi:acetyl-CoA carboxylase biotin carboxylase subunit